MASCKVGHVYIIDTVLTKPPKAKFAVCVCVANGYFLWINTKAAPHGRDQMALVAGCHQLVTHDSFLDVSRVVAHPPIELDEAREFACITKEIRDRIIALIDAGTTVLSPRHAALIKANLMALYQ